MRVLILYINSIVCVYHVLGLYGCLACVAVSLDPASHSAYNIIMPPRSEGLLVTQYIIIKKGWQCKAGRERLTPYQSEDPTPTIPTHRMKEEKGKTGGDKNGESSKANETFALLLKPASPTPSNTGLLRSLHRDTEKGIKVLLYCEVLQQGGA